MGSRLYKLVTHNFYEYRYCQSSYHIGSECYPIISLGEVVFKLSFPR
jgi:hypothetical protein